MVRFLRLLIAASVSTFLLSATGRAQEEVPDPAEVSLGERLFNDFRFSEFYFSQSQGDVNHELQQGDPQLDFLKLFENKDSRPSPFKGQASSCVSCHMVEQARDSLGLRMRTYADYASTSPIPVRDSQLNPSTLRNSQSVILVGPQAAELPQFLHWDGEFHSLDDLVVAGLVGRNLGWLVTEKNTALQNIVAVTKFDNGLGALAQDFGGFTYKEWLLSEDPLLPQEARLPESFRIDVDSASDSEIVAAVAKLISAYIRNLSFQLDEKGQYIGSPYDVFLAKNGLDRGPRGHESPKEYSERLLTEIQALQNPQFVSNADGRFETHEQDFVFGPEELQGLELFFTVPAAGRHQMAGACIQCHSAPHFTDFGFHNIGLSQFQYDSVHGFESFKKLSIPSLAEREAQPHLYGLPTAKHPARLHLLSSTPSKDDSRRADLGMWSLFANSEFSHLQDDFLKILTFSLPELPVAKMSPDEVLPLTIGLMKTPSLRNLHHSDPYFHDGHAATIEQVVGLYVALSRGARHGVFSPVDPKIKNIHMHGEHAGPIVRFLKALNEDYD